MMRFAGRVVGALLVCGLIAPAPADDRTADQIVKEIEGIKPARTMEEYKAGSAKKLELIGELKKAQPDHPRLKTLMPERWMALMVLDKNDEAIKEIDEALAKAEAGKEKSDLAYLKAQAYLNRTSGAAEEALPAVEEFIKLAPKDARAGMLLFSASRGVEDEARRTELEDRVLKDFSNRQFKAMIESSREMRAKVGKPFELAFEDATKGTKVSMKDLKGKVVVVDFWATWCGPCVAEMPNMKKLYAEYKDKGVEFIGVSLDQSKEQGGLDKLKEFVAKNDIQWPQYYQGNYWQSEFSSGWGINSIPCVFVVDADGKLYSTEARGKLEKLIPKLLEKAKGSAGAGGL